jgi:ABC-2 type transport system permease protein
MSAKAGLAAFPTQLGHELLKLFARRRTYIGYGAFALVQAAILGLLQLPKAQEAVGELLRNNGYNFEAFYGGLSLAVVMIVFTFMLLGALYLALVAGDIVAKEVEDGTMRMILSRPISRPRLLMLKLLACTIYAVTLIAFLAVTALILATVQRGYLGQLFVFVPEEELFAVFDTGEGLQRYALAMGTLSLTTLIITNTAFMFSCFPMKPAAATILTLSLLFIDTVLRTIPYFSDYRHFFVSHHTGAWVRLFHDPIPWWSLAQSLAYLGALNVSVVIVGFARFVTRDFKG